MADRWFKIPGEAQGDREPDEQMKGLGPLFAEVAGRRVLDLGCAEGLIGLECLKRGAAFVHGIEIVPGHIEVARKLYAEQDPARYSLQVGDLAEIAAGELASPEVWQYDVVLALAVLHKFKRIAPVAEFVAAAARDLAVIRYPSSCPNGVIIDERSNRRPFNVPAFMAERRFALQRTEKGPRREVTAYYRRQP